MNFQPNSGPDPIEELLLSAYPNPERRGCLDQKTLSDLGNLTRQENDPAWNHIWHCSPCFAEFKTIRDKRWAQQKWVAVRRRRRLIAGAVAGAASLLIITAIALLSWIQHPHAGPELAQITVDLSEIEVLRGNPEDTPVQLPPLPRKLDEIHLILPKSVEPGSYTVAILRSQSTNSAIALSSANANANQGKIELTVRLDLSTAAPGQYFLGTRRNDNQATSYFPVTVT
jgi:hypothetical protein